MKNFSDITAIDLTDLLKVEIELKEHNDPSYTFTVNDRAVSCVMYFGLLDDLYFNCKITAGALEIAKITINGKEVLPLYQHLANPATNWVSTDWKFTVPGPFYPWYHQITGQGWTA